MKERRRTQGHPGSHRHPGLTAAASERQQHVGQAGQVRVDRLDPVGEREQRRQRVEGLGVALDVGCPATAITPAETVTCTTTAGRRHPAGSCARTRPARGRASFRHHRRGTPAAPSRRGTGESRGGRRAPGRCRGRARPAPRAELRRRRARGPGVPAWKGIRASPSRTCASTRCATTSVSRAISMPSVTGSRRSIARRDMAFRVAVSAGVALPASVAQGATYDAQDVCRGLRDRPVQAGHPGAGVPGGGHVEEPPQGEALPHDGVDQGVPVDDPPPCAGRRSCHAPSGLTGRPGRKDQLSVSCPDPRLDVARPQYAFEAVAGPPRHHAWRRCCRPRSAGRSAASHFRPPSGELRGAPPERCHVPGRRGRRRTRAPRCAPPGRPSAPRRCPGRRHSPSTIAKFSRSGRWSSYLLRQVAANPGGTGWGSGVNRAISASASIAVNAASCSSPNGTSRIVLIRAA